MAGSWAIAAVVDGWEVTRMEGVRESTMKVGGGVAAWGRMMEGSAVQGSGRGRRRTVQWRVDKKGCEPEVREKTMKVSAGEAPTLREKETLRGRWRKECPL